MHAMISPYSRSPGQRRTVSPAGGPGPPGDLIPPEDKRTGRLDGADRREPNRKGPGQRLRTGVRPAGNGLGLRCLLGARALD